MHINFVIFNKFIYQSMIKCILLKNILLTFFLKKMKNQISKLRFENIRSIIKHDTNLAYILLGVLTSKVDNHE